MVDDTKDCYSCGTELIKRTKGLVKGEIKYCPNCKKILTIGKLIDYRYGLLKKNQVMW